MFSEKSAERDTNNNNKYKMRDVIHSASNSLLLIAAATITNRSRRALWCRLLIPFIFYLAFTSTFRSSSDDNADEDHLIQSQHPNFTKYILLWNYLPHRMTYLLGTGRDPFIRHGCDVTDCIINDRQHNNNNRSMNSYDAVVFNMNHLHHTGELPWRANDYSRNWERQRFVFLSAEPPAGYAWNGNNLLFADYFNWSMTYRNDADVQFFFGTTKRRRAGRVDNQKAKKTASTAQHNNKTTAVWMATNCVTDSRREDYIDQLKHFITVDSYGGCGNKVGCSERSSQSKEDDCYRMMESKYKFYLSFENSICTDYVTEKFFNILNYNLVPVVYGGADYNRIAPPHSFIDARQFNGPKELAFYLMALDANDALYNEYFKWKNDYVVESGEEKMVLNGFCNLCRKLHQDSHQPKIYTQLVDQFLPETQCITRPTIVQVNDSELIYWKRMDVDRLKPHEIIEYFNWKNCSSCKLVQQFGVKTLPNQSALNGQKSVCLDPLSVRPPVGNCIVYSFGINNEWSFDEAMAEYGCQVFSFDPSMDVGDHNRSQQIHFFNFGLGDRNHVKVSDDGIKNFTIKTLSSIYEMLAPYHGSEAVIDYLKVDMEFSEFRRAQRQIILSGMLTKVRQLGIEFHLPSDGDLKLYRNYARTIKAIEVVGMSRFDSHNNPWLTGSIKALNYTGSIHFNIAFYHEYNK